MWYFCKYKDFLGKPGEGLRRYRFLNLSLVDVFATLVLAWILQRYYFIYTHYLNVLLFTFIVINPDSKFSLNFGLNEGFL